ncbi:MAG: epoxyqueuosine reductase [Lentisphaerae bacterium]|jgi:epoxyqueuosine reductase|nr:epoxyqueuosine reductase [Lentisphaerota bacterium]
MPVEPASERISFYRGLAARCGADQIACLKADSCPPLLLQQRLDAWRQAGNFGALPYLDNWSAILSDPFAARPWARSLLVLSFAPQPNPASPLWQLPSARPGRPAATIARYALCVDYHRHGQAILEQLRQAIATIKGSDVQFDSCVDTKPVMEKELALLAGLGVRGRNGLLRTPNRSCQAHLAVLFCSSDLPQHILPSPLDLHCGDCHACVSSCPNHAIGKNGILAVRKCRSWLANEKRGALSWPEQLALGSSLFACSICTSCCPDAVNAGNINANAESGDVVADIANVGLWGDYAVDAEELLRMPSAELSRIIAGTALDYVGATQLKRNAAAAFAVQATPQQRRDRQAEFAALSNSPTVTQTIANWD